MKKKKQKLHSKQQIHVIEADIPGRQEICKKDAIMNAMMVTYYLLKDVDLKHGDTITVDVRILVK